MSTRVLVCQIGEQAPDLRPYVLLLEDVPILLHLARKLDAPTVACCRSAAGALLDAYGGPERPPALLSGQGVRRTSRRRAPRGARPPIPPAWRSPLRSSPRTTSTRTSTSGSGTAGSGGPAGTWTIRNNFRVHDDDYRLRYDDLTTRLLALLVEHAPKPTGIRRHSSVRSENRRLI